MRVFHYTNCDHSPGIEISSGRDSIVMLTEAQRVFEVALRDGHTDGHAIRSQALYTWETVGLIERNAERLRKRYKYFYELEVDEADILHRGDLNVYTRGYEAGAKNLPMQEYVDAYWKGEVAPNTPPLIEILVRKAKVIRLL